ncbi:unnamed protein product, partial [Polarella glacialis]
MLSAMRRQRPKVAAQLLIAQVLFLRCLVVEGQTEFRQQEHQVETPGTLHWVLAVLLILVLVVGLMRVCRVLRMSENITIARSAPEGMRTVECGSCRIAQYVSAQGRIFICFSCHCANRIPIEIPRMAEQELVIPVGPLKKFEFKKGGENYWQERSFAAAYHSALGLQGQVREGEGNSKATKSVTLKTRGEDKDEGKDKPEKKAGAKKKAIKKMKSKEEVELEHIDLEPWEAAVAYDWRRLIDAPEAVTADKNIVRLAVKQSWKAFEHAAEALQDDEELALIAVQGSWWAVELCGENAGANQDVALAAIRQNILAFESLSLEIRDNKPLMMEAVCHDGATLQYASEELRSQRDLVLAAVQTAGGEALVHAAEELRNEEELVLLALRAPKGADMALVAAGGTLQADPEFVLKVLGQNGLCLQYAPLAIQDNRKFVMA